jgi:hypothetical protein
MFDVKMAIFGYQHVKYSISRHRIRIDYEFFLLDFQKNIKQFFNKFQENPSLNFSYSCPLSG